MKLSCLQDNLTKGLSIVGRAVPVRSTLPQASHIKLETDQGRLKLVATDLTMAVTCWIGAQIEEEGSITIPARLLTDFVASLPNEKIDLSVSERGHQLHITCARNEATMAGMDAEDFPPVPPVDDGLSINLGPAELSKAITQVQFAAATDDTRPVLTGIHTLAEEQTLTLAAADGFRLAVHKLALTEEVPEKVEVIVPVRALREVERLLSDQTDQVEMSINGGRTQVLFKMNSVEIVATLIQGTFPNYGQLIPSSFTSRAEIDMKQFLQETRIAAIFARDGAGIVKLQMEPSGEGRPGKPTNSARAEEIGDNLSEIDAAIDGEADKIAFNSKYLQDYLQVLEGGRVSLEMSGPSRQGVLRPVGDENFVHVLMPMVVQW